MLIQSCRGVRFVLFASVAATAILTSNGSALAVCAPVAGNDVTAVCTGVTTDQNAPNGYGNGTETNLNVIVAPGASLTSTSDIGIALASGTVDNAGAISANGLGGAGVFATAALAVTNSGTITANAGFGIFADATTVTNSGTISSGTATIFGSTSATVINSGTISVIGSTGNAIGGGSAMVNNSGTITAIGDFATAVAGGTALITNSGTISASGLLSSAVGGLTVTVNNSGTISTSGPGGAAVTGNVSLTLTNSGTISANSAGAFAVTAGIGAVTNSGIISAAGTGGVGIAASTAVVTNSGTISVNGSNGIGIFASDTAQVTNSGIISANAADGRAVVIMHQGTVTNSGTIIGGGGTAVGFHAIGGSGGDTLNVLPGAKFGGLIDFDVSGGVGGADTVNFGPGSWIINTANFNAALSTVTTPGNPYVVTPNQIIVADLSGFGAQNRALMGITGWIASVLPDAPVLGAGAGGAVNSFAAGDGAADPFAAFDRFPANGNDALGYAKAPAFKAASVAYAEGHAVWAKAFGGQRQQDTSGTFIGATTTGYGGAVGYERMATPDLKLGALIGGSTNRTNLALNAGSTTTDTVFGGAYGRKTWGGTFLDLAVIGGNLDNRNVRNIGGGLAFVTANASYGGWFVMPSMMLGQRIDIDKRGFTITPAVKVRYVAAAFDGYSETGAGVANVAVGSRSFGAWDERAEITFANTSTLSGGDRITARVTGGILAQQRTGGGFVNIALVGQNFVAATPDRASVTGGYGSAGLDWQIGKVTLFAAGEATYTSDVARLYAGKGGFRVTW